MAMQRFGLMTDGKVRRPAAMGFGRDVCPECAQDKHANCTGWAFDDSDNEVACCCPCRD